MNTGKASVLFAGLAVLGFPALSAAREEGAHGSGKTDLNVEPVRKDGTIEIGTEGRHSSKAETKKKHNFEYDTDRCGEDYKDLDIPAADPTLRADACAGEAECRAWTMVKPAVQGELAK